MGIYDRPYMRDDANATGGGSGGGSWFLDHFNHVFIAANVIIWFLANGAAPQQRGQINAVLDNLALSLDNLQAYRYWTLLTSGMTEMSAWNMLFNMLLLFYFGKEIQALYGRINLIWLYFLTLVVSSGAFLLAAWLGHLPGYTWFYGGQSLVMCVLVLITFWYPSRPMTIFFLLPVPMFILTPLYVILLIFDYSQNSYGRAFYAAPLAGSALGMLFYFLDLRIARGNAMRLHTGLGAKLANLLSGVGKKGGGSAALSRMERRENTYEPSSGGRGGGVDEAWDSPRAKLSAAEVARVDQLLAKIAKEGKEALTAEELAFLNVASKKYR